MVLYPRSGFGGKIFVLGSIRFNQESIDSRFLQIVGGILESLGINNNRTIYGTPNYIPIPSNLWYVVKKSCEDTFMRIAEFVYN